MGRAVDLARLLNSSGLVPDAKLLALAASKLSGQVPDANAPSGSVIQVVTYPWNTLTAINADGVFTLITGDITVRANSKIVCLANIMHFSGAGGTWHGSYQCSVFENGIIVSDGEHEGTISNEAQAHNIPMMYTSPARSAGTYTYSIRGNRVIGGYHEFNRSPRQSTMILMEIAA